MNEVIDYEPFLNQQNVWPRLDDHRAQIDNMAIEDMAHQYAISAFHKLLRWSLGSSRLNVNNSPLARALLTQAVGEPVWLLSSADIPDQALKVLRSKHQAHQPSEVSLELCFDALAFLDKYSQGNSEHEVTKALRLQGYLNDQLWKEKHD